MNKAALVSRIAEKTDLTKKDADTAVNAMMEVIAEALQSGEKVQLSGFGMFEPKHRAARQGRNPKTKQPIDIPARTVPSFKPGKGLLEALK